MEYRLICNGRLVEGTDEAKAVEGLSKLTGVPEKDIREKLLSNKRVKLKSSTDKAEIEALYADLSALGLDVELEENEKSSSKRAARSSSKGKSSRESGAGTRNKWVLGITVIILLLFGGAGVYLWNLTRISYPPEAKIAEAALANGKAVAIAHANVSKLVELNRLAFGKMDPATLPVDGATQDIMSALFDGPANLRGSLDQLLVAVYATEADQSGKTALLMLGDFNQQAVLGTYRQQYELDDAEGESRWHVLREKAVAKKTNQQCPEEHVRKRPQQPTYLFADSRSILLIDDLDYGKQLVQRLQSRVPAQQDLARWQRYRDGKLASLMILSIPEAGKAIGGMQGMMMNQAGSENAEISSLAAGLKLDLNALGLKANLSLFSADEKWKTKTSSSINQALDKIKKDTRKVTPTMAGLLSRIQVDNQKESLQVNVGLDRTVLDNLGNVLQESLASFMGMGMTASQPSGPVQEQLQRNPVNYASNKALTSLPPLKLESYETEPLFRQGAFAVDLTTVRQNDDGVFEVQLQGKVSLPKNENSSGGGRTGELALHIDAVTNAKGENLLRDEHCLSPNDLFGRSPNHEPETTTSLFQDNVQISKYLRLRPDVRALDIHRIEGIIRFSTPVSVREYSVPLQAGETIEEGGIRFYLSRIGDNSVSYQVSGKKEKLLEVRALNKDGKALRSSWRISSGDDGRITQNYQGKIHALKIFVTKKIAVHKANFQLDKLFSPSEKEKDGARPVYLAPGQIPAEAWDEYKSLDMLRLEIDPDNWHMTGKKTKPIAEEHWRGVSLYLTHTPSQWGNSPWAHVYYPMLEQLPAVLSAVSYQIEKPAEKDVPRYHYVRVSYPYNTQSGEVVARHTLNGKPVAMQSLQLKTGLEDNQRLDRIKGKLIFRLPTKTASTTLALPELWQGQTVNGVKVSLTSLDRGMFPGYSLKIEGDIEKLVNLHGLGDTGQRVIAEPVNYQQDGYWTMTLPFGKGIESVELVLAEKQAVMEYPFDLKPTYPYSN